MLFRFSGRLAVLLLCAFLTTVAHAATRVIHVKSDASATGANGASWATAFPSLTAALSHANTLNPTSSDPVQIWIANGTYKPATPDPDPENGIFEPDPRDGTFAVKSHVSLYGGFSGTETALNQRSFSDSAPMTVLSGDIGSTYLTGEAAPTTKAQALLTTVRDPENSNFADNVTNVVTITDGVGITLDHLLITAGYAKNLATVPLPYVQEMAMPDAANETTLGSKRAITREAAGGGIHIYSSALPGGTAVTITDCVFAQNHAFGFGGALAILRSRVSSRSNYYVANSAADSGGAVFGRAQHSSFEGDVMVRNLSQGSGGAVHVNAPAARPSNWANSDARFLFGSDSKFALDTVSDQIDVAAMFPGIAAPRAGLLTLEGSMALSTKLGTVAAGSVASNFAGISTGPLKYVTAAIDITDLIVNELRVQGVNGEFIDFWVGDFMPKFNSIATPQGWYKTYKHAFYDDAKFNENTEEWQVKRAYDIFYNPAAPTRFINVRFDHNTAYGDGGALFALHANYLVDHSLFTENSAERSGGALAARAFNDAQVVNSVFSANSSAGHSAICLSQSARLRLLNCTVVNNASTSPGAALGVELGSESRVLNSVLWGNTNPSLPSGGADIYTATPGDLDETTRKIYDAAPPHRFTFVGMTDIVGSNVQGLASLTNNWGVSDIRYLSGSNLSDADIRIAGQLRDLADFSSTTDLFELTVMGTGNRYLHNRGNISVDPQLHDGWLPSINSPLINNGRRDAFGLGLSPYASESTDFLGLPRTQDYTTISIGAVQSPATSGGGSAEAVGRYFVTPTGAGDKSGRNWANASDDLKAMLAQENVEVWVAAGTYKPSVASDRFASFTLGQNTRAYGGFAGTETVFADRDVSANVTVLSGQLAGAQSYHVIKQVNTDGSILLDGFTITGGKADGSSENATGGGAYLFNTASTLRNLTFDDNTATDTGGAVHSGGEALVGFYDCVLTENDAAAGGAIYAINPLLVERCRFDSNTATDQGGAIAVDTNGDSDQRADFQNSLFSRNRVTATGAGSALYVNVMLNQIVNCTFTKNEGRVYTADDPNAGQFGSAVYYNEAGAIIINSLFWKNASDDFLASGTPLELASLHVSREESFGLSLVHSNLEGLSLTNPLTGAARAQGSLSSQMTRVGNIYIRTGSSSNSFIDAGYDYDPKFVDFANNDFRLSANSDIVDHGKSDAAGVGTLDVAGGPRKVNNVPDVGAYELQGSTDSVFSVVTQSRTLTADGPVFTLVLHPENPLGSDATYTWMVNKNDGKGFVALPADSRISGQGTDTLTLSQPPSEWSGWIFRVAVGGANTATASLALQAKGSQRFYVNGAVSASGNGLSWATAFKTISEATKAARTIFSTTDYCQIWVAQGTYNPDRYGETSIFLYSGMVLYGGFKGTETSQSQRNPALYPTVLTGAQPGAKDYPDYATNTVQTAPASTTLPIVIDGFTIRTANRYAIDALRGGSGFYPVTISHCIIENELGGGASLNTDVTLKDVIFRKNKTRAVYVSGGTISFERTLFSQNTGSEGAALYVAGGSVTLKTSTIADNFATTRVGGIYLSGGTLAIDQSILWSNRDNATELGAALEPSQLRKVDGTLTITNSLIEGLSTFSGGGNLGVHPLFNDPLNGNYTLAPQSPAIALGAGAFPYVGVAGSILRFTGIPNSSEERTSLFSKTFTITWPSDTVYSLGWQIDLGNGWVDPSSATFTTSTSNNATSSTFTISSGSVLPSLKVRAVLPAGIALPAITLKVIPPVVRYVNASATGTANGLSWSTAYRTLEAAYQNLPGPNVELWVAKGTYDLTGTTRAQPGVALYGGFAGTETSLNQRALNSSTTTTLRGTFLIQTGNFTYGQGIPVAATSVGRQVVLDGFRVEQTGSAAQIQATSGAGIIRNCEFVGTYSQASLRNVSTIFENCSFSGCTEPAVKITGGNPAFRQCAFTGNVGNYAGAAIDASNADVLVDRSTFKNNIAKYSEGGAIRATGGLFTVANSLFTGNVADNGGALAGGPFALVNCTVAGNRGVKKAGGLYSTMGSTVANSIFWSNTATADLYGDTAAKQKAQITQHSGSLVVNNTIVEGLVGNLGTDNLPYNPLFLGTGSNPYQLTASSPAIGRALTSVLDAVSPVSAYPGRNSGGNVDLGAFEFSGTPTATPLQLAVAPSSANLFTGATSSFVVSGGSGLGANVVWERLVNGNWVLVSGTGFSVATTSTSSTLTLTSATTGQSGDYRYRIASLNYTSAIFNVSVATRRVVYVDAAAPVGGNGATWGTAFRSPADVSALADAAIEVRIAAGTYANPNITLRPGLYFRGGYPATGSASQRETSNPSTNPTIFTGNSIAYGDGTNVVFNSSTGFEGITFRGTGSAQQYQRGVLVFFRNCRIENTPGGIGGFAGAVTFDYNSSGLFEDCTFANNSGTTLATRNFSSVRILRGTFTGNRRVVVGTARDGSFTIEDSTFTENAVVADEYLIDTNLDNISSSAIQQNTITRSRFLNNSGEGRLIGTFGGVLTVTDSLFAHNTCQIAYLATDATFLHVTAVDNVVPRSTSSGQSARPLIVHSGGVFTLKNSIFWGNRAIGASDPIGLQQVKRSGGHFDFHFNLFENSSALDASTPSDNFSTNPLFADPSTGNYQLTAYSPAVAAGSSAASTALDLQLGSRSGTPDLGAYDFTGTAATPLMLASVPVSVTTFLRNTASFTVTGTAGANITWLRWNGSAYVVIDSNNPDDARLSIVNTSDGSTLFFANVASSDTGGFAYQIGGYTSARLDITPAVRPRVYVDASNTTNGDGSSWAQATRYLESAYKYAPENAEIWVKQGSYNASATIRAGIELYGGFSTNATDVSQRDLTGATVVITGQFVGRAATPNALFDGVTFTAGYRPLIFSGGADPIFRRCVIRDCSAGGVYVSGGNPVFEDCKFRANRDGSIVVTSGNPVVVRGDFTGGGRAISVSSGLLTVRDSMIHDNAGTNLLVQATMPGEIVFDRCTIRDNTGEQLVLAFDGKITLRNSLVLDNNSNYDGVLNAYQSAGRIGRIEIIHSTIYGNESVNGPGAIFASGGTVTVRNSIVWQNRGRSTRNPPLTLEEQQIWRRSGTLTLQNTIVEGFSTLGGTGNLASAPLFTEAASDDFTLSASSPAMDAGDATLDQTGFALDRTGGQRVAGGAPDLGAYEFTGTPGTTLHIVRSPVTVDVETGGTATFVAESVNAGTFTWQIESSPGAWTDIVSGVDGYTIVVNGNVSTLSFAGADATNSGTRLRYRFGTAVSAPFSFTVVDRRTIYVDPLASGTADGTTWATAYRSIQDAISDWSVGAEIWVSRRATIDLTTSVVLEEGMKIFGGFAGNEVSLEQRPAGSQTTLRNPSSAGGLGYFVDQSGTPVTPVSIFDGFSCVSQRGAIGLLLVNSSPIIRNCTFSKFSNSVVQNSGGQPQFVNCTFVSNYSNALVEIGGSSLVQSCTFDGNDSAGLGYVGSAIRVQGSLSGSNTQVSDSIFRSNRNTAIFVSAGDIVFDRCTWTGNVSSTAPVLQVQHGAGATLRSSLIANNTASFLHDNNNSSVIINNGALTLVNVTVAGNSATSWGGTPRRGGILYNDGPLTIANSIFAENTVSGNLTGLTAEEQQIYRGSVDVPAISNSLITGLSAFAGNGNIGYPAAFDPAYPGEYRLSLFSPAVNAGDSGMASSDTDLAQGSRIVGASIDIGARELQETVGVLPIQVNVDANSGNIVPVWSTAPGKLVINGSIQVTSAIYWEIQIDGEWMSIAADNSLSSSYFGDAATLTIAAPTSDDTPDRLIRFGVRGTSYISPTYTITATRNNVRYVASFVPAGGDGLNWDTAYNNLADAIAEAPSHTEIWIAGGTYTDTSTIVLPAGIRIYGGFNGYGRERYLSERRPTQNIVRIRNSFTINSAQGSDTPIFDGLQLQGGSVSLFHRSAIFRNVRFDTGGALSASSYAPSLLLEDCQFVNKDVALSGFIDNVTIRRTTFSGNEVAIANANGIAWTIEDSKFENSVNRTNSFTGHFLTSVVPTLTVSRTSFSGANSRINAISLSQPNGTTVKATFTDCTFSGNKNTFNGAGVIEATGLALEFDRCVFTGNASQGGSTFGSASVMKASGVNLTIRNSYFADNTTNGAPSPVGTSHGALYLINSSSALTGVTIVNNTAPTENVGGIVVDGGALHLANSILYGNNGASGTIEQRQLSSANAGDIDVTSTLIEGLDAYAGDGNIGYNPRFISVNGRLAPGLDSPARNVGDNTKLLEGEIDLFGNVRTNETVVDFGAIEPTTTASAVTLDLALTRRVAGGYLEITYDNSRNYTGLTWQIDTGSGWQTLSLPADAFITSGASVIVRLPWNAIYEGASIRLIGANYTSPTYIVAFGEQPPTFGSVVATTPATGAIAGSRQPSVTFTYDQALAANQLSSTSFVVHSSLHGALNTGAKWGSVTNDLLTPTLSLGTSFNAGEIIDVTSTRDIFSALGGAFYSYVSRFSIPWTSRAGAFRIGSTLPTTGAIAGASAGDLNGDGIGDLLLAGENGAWIFLGNEDGGFTQLNFGAVGDWNAFATADFNSDGRVDFVGSRNSSSLTIETVNVVGDASTSLLSSSLAFAGSRLLPADFNGDGRQDVLVLGPSSSDGEVLLLNNADGTFTPAGEQRFAPADDRTREAAIADLNHDGKLDFVQVRAATGDIIVWLNDGSGVFTSDNSVRVASTQTIALTDVDRDGWTDLVVASGSSTDTLHVYRNDQTGNLVHQRSFAGGNVLQLAAADFDGDGDNDFLAITGTSPAQLWRNNGSAVFTATPLAQTFAGASATAQLVVADLNHDGAADVMLPQFASPLLWAPGNYFTGFSKTLLEATTLTFAESDFTSVTTNYGGPVQDSYRIESLPAHGTLRGNGNALSVGQHIVFGSGNTYTYTPTGHYYGSDSFKVAPSDYLGRSPSGKVVLEITRVVDAPAGTALTLTTFKNQPRSLTLVGTHPENERITFSLGSQGTHGDVQLTGDRATYTPNTDYVGTDSFTYLVSDDHGNSTPATVFVTVSDTTVTVTSTAGSGPGSLTDAIATINSNGGVGRVVFSPSLDNEILVFDAATDTAHGPTAVLVSNYLEIDGTATPGLQIYRNFATSPLRFFRVLPDATLALRNIKFVDGRATNESPTLPARGGAIYNEGNVVLDGAKLYSNRAESLDSTGSEGGAIYNDGGSLTILDTWFDENEAVDGSGGVIFMRNGTARFNETTFFENTASVSGPRVHLFGDNAAVTTTWINTRLEGLGTSTAGTGTVAILDKNTLYPVPTDLTPSIDHIAVGQILEGESIPLTVRSENAVVTIATTDHYVYRGNTLPTLSIPETSGTSRTLTVGLAEDTGGVITVLLTATENGVSYTGEFDMGFLTSVYLPPVANDQEIYLVDGAATAVNITATQPDNEAVSYEILTLPANGQLSGTAPNLTYDPQGYFGNDYLIYRATTPHGRSVSARVTFRSVPLERTITTADAEGPGSLTAALDSMPALVGVMWDIKFAPELAGATIDVPTRVLLTAQGRTAYRIASQVRIDGSDAPGLRLLRSDNAPEMRLFNIAPEGYFELRNVALENGLAAGESGQPGRGGAIYVESDNDSAGFLLLDGVTLKDNVAIGGSGADGQGGAIYNDGGDVSVQPGQSHFIDNTALGGSGGSGRGGALYSRNGDVFFFAPFGDPSSTFSGNAADSDANIALVADGAVMTAGFAFTNVNNVGTSALNGGTVDIDAGYGSLVTGPSLISVAPPGLLLAPSTLDVPLTLAGGVPTTITSSNPSLFAIQGTLANPILRVDTSTFPQSHSANIILETTGYRFTRLVDTAYLDYSGPTANQDQAIDVTMNQSVTFTLDASFNPNLTASYQLMGGLTRIHEGNPVAGDTGTLTGTAPEFTFTPPAQFVGTIQFAYEISDDANQAIGIVRFTVANGLPTAEETYAEAQSGDGATTTVTAVGGHTTGDAITYALVSQPQHGSVTQIGNTNQFIYTALAGYLTEDHIAEAPNYGYDIFTFKTVDSTGQESAPTKFFIYVADLAAFQAPVITGLPEAPGVQLPDSTNMGEPNEIFANVSITDTDSALLTVRIPLFENGYIAPDSTASDWEYTYSPAFGDLWQTTGTPAQVTARVRDLVAYSQFPNDTPRGTTADDITVQLIISDERTAILGEGIFRGFVPYDFVRGNPPSQWLSTPPVTPITFQIAATQADGRPFTLYQPIFLLITQGGSENPVYTEITDLSPYGTLVGGPSTPTTPMQNGDVFTYTFTPAEGFSDGIAIFWDLSTDLTQFPLTSMSVEVAVNWPPVGVDDTVSRGPNALSIPVADLVANDIDPDFVEGDYSIDFVSVAPTSANGVALSYASGIITYAASALITDDSFVYTLVDARGATATGTVHVLWQNNAPTPADDTFERTYGQPLTLTAGLLLANDSDPENDTIAVTGVSGASAQGGTVALTDGLITYTPTAESTLADSFTYTITDSRGATADATVTVTIANRSPVAADRTLTRYNDQPAQVAIADLLALAADPEGDALQIVQVDEYSVLGGDIAHDPAAITYTTQTPSLVKDEDFFTYEIADTHGATSTGFITVQLLNRAPTAGSVTIDRYDDDLTTAIPIATLLAAASDADGHGLSFAGAAASSSGGAALTVVGDDVVYAPASLPHDTDDTFTFTIEDSQGESATGTVTLRVVNRAPIATNDLILRTAGEDATVSVAQLLSNDTDPDGDELAFVSVSATSAQGATVSVSGGVVTYSLNGPIIGNDSFTYTIRDPNNETATATVTIETEGAEAPPVLTIEPRTAGGVTLHLVGTRYTIYTVSVSTDLLVWTEFNPNVATDANGLATLDDTEQPAEGAARFYRAEAN